MKSIEFSCRGEPQSKGSTNSFLMGWPAKKWSYVKRQAALIKLAESIKAGNYPTITVTSTNKGLKAWEKIVRSKAEAAMAAEEGPWKEPVRLVMTFFMNRPSNHFGTGRNQRIIKPWAEKMFCTKAPDLDKLIRSIGDALNNVVYEDDSQVVEIIARKKFATKNGVTVKAETIDSIETITAPTQGLLFELDQQTPNMNGVVR